MTDLCYWVKIDGTEQHGTNGNVPGDQNGNVPGDPPGDPRVELIVEEDAETGVKKCHVEITNCGGEEISLQGAEAGVVLAAGIPRVHYFTSSWGKEYAPCEQAADKPFTLTCTAGRSSMGYIPFVEVETAETHIEMALAWSGNWTFRVEDIKENAEKAVTFGFTAAKFCHVIAPGETFSAPAVYIVECAEREQGCLMLRRYYKKHLSTIDERMFTPMPLEFNTWWPYEERFINEEVYQQNVEQAAALGMRYAMLDAGWFGKTEEGVTWVEKRGDWENVNTDLFPSGLKALCDKAKACNVLPGIWCEIEAVGRDAELKKLRPELLARRNGEDLGYVCFGSKKTREWAMGICDRILGEYGAKWIKFDFNLDPGFGCDREDHDHQKGDGLYAHYMGYYAFLDELHRKYPDVVIENCSSGGLRGDIEMMSHCQVGFLADPDWTEFHLQLYWGALSFLHQRCLLHFSWSQILGDHNLDVQDSMKEPMAVEKLDYMIRAVMMGVPGFSLRLPEIAEWQRNRIRELGEFYTKYSADFILNGDAYRLTEQPQVHGKGERFPVFEFVSTDARALVFAFRMPGAGVEQKVLLQGLDPERVYTVTSANNGKYVKQNGAFLMKNGVKFENLCEESSEVLIIE